MFILIQYGAVNSRSRTVGKLSAGRLMSLEFLVASPLKGEEKMRLVKPQAWFPVMFLFLLLPRRTLQFRHDMCMGKGLGRQC